MKALLLAALIMMPSEHVRSVESYRDRARPLVIFAPVNDDPRMREQVALLKDAAAGLKERQVVLLPVVAGRSDAGSELGALWRPLEPVEQEHARHKYGVQAGEFVVILIGKDGGEKQRWRDPVAARKLYGIIDAMPMRQDEMKHSPAKD